MWPAQLSSVGVGFSAGEATGQMIDKETREVVDQQYERVKKLLLQHEEHPMLWREYVSDSFKPVMLKASARRRLMTSVAFRVGIESAVLKCSKLKEQGSVLQVAPASACSNACSRRNSARSPKAASLHQT